MPKDEDTTKLSAQERAALRDRTRELKAAKKGAEAEQAVLEAIAALSDDERPLAERVHALIREAAPELAPIQGPESAEPGAPGAGAPPTEDTSPTT